MTNIYPEIRVSLLFVRQEILDKPSDSICHFMKSDGNKLTNKDALKIVDDWLKQGYKYYPLRAKQD